MEELDFSITACMERFVNYECFDDVDVDVEIQDLGYDDPIAKSIKRKGCVSPDWLILLFNKDNEFEEEKFIEVA